MQAQTEWVMHTEYPDLRDHDEIAIDLETRDTELKSLGASRNVGFQLRYIYFLNPAARQRLTVPEIPFSKIDEMGAGMYKGVAKRVSSETSDTPDIQSGKGGATPTDALQLKTNG